MNLFVATCRLRTHHVEHGRLPAGPRRETDRSARCPAIAHGHRQLASVSQLPWPATPSAQLEPDDLLLSHGNVTILFVANRSGCRSRPRRSLPGSSRVMVRDHPACAECAADPSSGSASRMTSRVRGTFAASTSGTPPVARRPGLSTIDPRPHRRRPGSWRVDRSSTARSAGTRPCGEHQNRLADGRRDSGSSRA